MSSSPYATDAELSDWRELTSREGDGLAVTLLWNPATDRIVVAVSDERLGEQFELYPAGADALAAFNHPFAYAAAAGFTYGTPREPADLQPQV
jgi:hypothetical protein